MQRKGKLISEWGLWSTYVVKIQIWSNKAALFWQSNLQMDQMESHRGFMNLGCARGWIAAERKFCLLNLTTSYLTRFRQFRSVPLPTDEEIKRLMLKNMPLCVSWWWDPCYWYQFWSCRLVLYVNKVSSPIVWKCFKFIMDNFKYLMAHLSAVLRVQRVVSEWGEVFNCAMLWKVDDFAPGREQIGGRELTANLDAGKSHYASVLKPFFGSS